MCVTIFFTTLVLFSFISPDYFMKRPYENVETCNFAKYNRGLKTKT